jgi:hypothetical protein
MQRVRDGAENPHGDVSLLLRAWKDGTLWRD